ncbi:MAG: hypothetical protein A2381_16915 [Bdellovibrionales bacterium RIFOXYB1_FULL_37_110]|nr:MAG: hypothetical protein A2417_18750 [Bdellovibrionales bacterium RIFOXYC1_FULL_37_79]OFZ59986.1 MAG: hypothetical protein A2381_16915 [Bdellovibrionales bacterium RIFOXYB1_FULL_37_110]OFZ63957.1 MAG: hypothetical protein A2577_06105 [Bdellovibrionales bacterium RIFOXYD1_FULL_36_51]
MVLSKRHLFYIWPMGWLLIVLLLGWTYPVVELFNKLGEYPRDYDVRIRNLKENDVVKMPDGKRFRVMERMTTGHSTAVLKVIPIDDTFNLISEYVILRLPKNQQAKAEFNQYLLGIKEIQNTSLASPEHYVFKDKYVVAEYIEHTYNADQFLTNPRITSDREWQEAASALKEYALNNQDLQEVGDFRAEQLIYDRQHKKWRLIDWMGGVDRYRDSDHAIDKHLFTWESLKLFTKPENVQNKSKALLAEINDAIVEQRLVVHYHNLNPTASSEMQAILSKKGFVARCLSIILGTNWLKKKTK